MQGSKSCPVKRRPFHFKIVVIVTLTYPQSSLALYKPGSWVNMPTNSTTSQILTESINES